MHILDFNRNISADTMTEEQFNYKQVLIVRMDLEMKKGKIAVQVAHASVSAMEITKTYNKKWVKNWLNEGQKKVALKVQTLEDLLTIKEKLDKQKIPNVIIQDRGLTQIPEGSVTALGAGPCPNALIDPITGTLQLL